MRPPSTPDAKMGVLDLRTSSFPESGPVALKGQWEFYWARFFTPDSFAGERPGKNDRFLRFPGYWNGYTVMGKTLPGNGYATFRLTILLKDGKKRKLALYLPTIETACRLYADGRIIEEIGTPGVDARQSHPAWKPMIVELENHGNSVELVLHVSNFNHVRGGPGESILFGTERDIRKNWVYAVAVKLILFGGLFMIALYHAVIFLLRRKEWSALYFSLFCFLMAVRSLLIEQFCIQLIIPDIPWDILIRITYLTFSLGFPAFTLFLYSLYPEEVGKWGMRIFTAAGILYTILILFFPAAVFTRVLFSFQLILITGAVYGLIVLAIAVKRRRDDALFLLITFIFYFLCILNDTLHHIRVIRTAYIAPLGFIMFVFLQSILLSRKYSRMFVKLEKLFEEKTKLEGTALSLENLSYMDFLTGLSNRRRLDEYLLNEWRRAQRTRTCLSLIMIDIDFFKQYNDHYGHMAGDEVLQQVAGVLGSSFSRPGDFIARYGGEEFAVVLPNTDHKGALTIAELMRNNVIDLHIQHNFSSVEDVVTISLGYTTMMPGDGISASQLIINADRALYRSKQKGRNRTCS